jgi:hypothetical protein
MVGEYDRGKFPAPYGLAILPVRESGLQARPLISITCWLLFGYSFSPLIELSLDPLTFDGGAMRILRRLLAIISWAQGNSGGRRQ